MYNQARYNLQRFNLPGDTETDIEYAGVMQETLGASVGYGEDTYLVETVAEQFQSVSMLDPCVQMVGVADETLFCGVAMVVNYLPVTNMLEEISALCYLCADSYQRIICSESMLVDISIGADLLQAFLMADSIRCRYTLGGDFGTAAIMFEIIDGEVTSTNFNIYQANFDVTIPPGSTLIIDSDNFVALLDGENIIHLHNGDWLSLCRDTYDIQVQMGQLTPFEVTMIYQERYL